MFFFLALAGVAVLAYELAKHATPSSAPTEPGPPPLPGVPGHVVANTVFQTGPDGVTEFTPAGAQAAVLAIADWFVVHVSAIDGSLFIASPLSSLEPTTQPALPLVQEGLANGIAVFLDTNILRGTEGSVVFTSPGMLPMNHAGLSDPIPALALSPEDATVGPRLVRLSPNFTPLPMGSENS